MLKVPKVAQTEKNPQRRTAKKKRRLLKKTERRKGADTRWSTGEDEVNALGT